MGPGTPPDHGTSGNDRQAAENQQNETDVRYSTRKVSRNEDKDEANAPEWELKEYRVECGPTVLI